MYPEQAGVGVCGGDEGQRIKWKVTTLIPRAARGCQPQELKVGGWQGGVIWKERAWGGVSGVEGGGVEKMGQ